MTLEAAIQENTTAIRELCARLAAMPEIKARPTGMVPELAAPFGGAAPKLSAQQAADALDNQHGKAKKESALAKPSAPAPAPVVDEPDAPALGDSLVPEYTLVKDAVLKLAVRDKPAAIEILKGFGVARATELVPEQYAAILAALAAANKLLAGD